jgi:hypothetical protein
VGRGLGVGGGRVADGVGVGEAGVGVGVGEAGVTDGVGVGVACGQLKISIELSSVTPSLA